MVMELLGLRSHEDGKGGGGEAQKERQFLVIKEKLMALAGSLNDLPPVDYF